MIEVPAKITISGDVEAGKALIGSGHRQMAILENLMSFNGLEQYAIKMSPYPGAVITCKKVFGLRTIEIVTDSGGGKSTSEDKKCFCFPHFSLGVIRKVYPEEPTELDLRTNRFKHDVDICTGSGYVAKEGVYAAGWERYYVGQYVLVTIGAKLDEPPFADFDQDRSCLMQSPQFETFTISPFYIHGGMQKWVPTQLQGDR